jgi:nucleotide-binding universal stress UspA family protein
MPKKHGTDTILVPVDFSANSAEALVFALDLGKRVGIKIKVLHVVHDPGYAPGYYAVKGRKKQLRRMEENASELFDAFLAEVGKKKRFAKAISEIDKLIVRGLPVTRILEVVEEVKPYMLVMGSQGRTGLSRMLLGSKAEQLVRLCPVPVTIVK